MDSRKVGGGRHGGDGEGSSSRRVSKYDKEEEQNTYLAVKKREVS